MLLNLQPGRPPLPKEHGGWAMMLTPPVVALLGAGPDPLGFMALLGWVAAYCLRGPVEALLGQAPTGRAGLNQANPAVARFWLVVFGLISAALLAPVVYYRPIALALLGAALVVLIVVLALAQHGQTRSFAAGALATVGLMAGGPLYYVAARGAVGAPGWTLGLAGAAFFVGSVFRVKTLAREKRSSAFRVLSVAFHAAVVAGALFAGAWLVALALLPALGWAIYGAARAGEPVSLNVIGKGEQWLTILFGLLLVIALRFAY